VFETPSIPGEIIPAEPDIPADAEGDLEHDFSGNGDDFNFGV
jgi:hypothetical protein